MRSLPRTKPSRPLFFTDDASDPPAPAPAPAPAPPKPAEDKDAKLHRRMQVRRAQFHHRQRKANHVKQLELDVCQLRDLIALAEHDSRALRRQNDDMGALLRSVAGPAPAAAQRRAPAWPASLKRLASPDMFGDVDVDDLTVTLSVSDVMGTPCFQISPRCGSTAAGSRPAPEQEQKAINFILALEHVCWDHFALGDFHTHAHQSEEPRGHALTASAYLMASAPESVYAEREAFGGAPARSFWGRARRSPTPPVLRWAAPAVTLASLLGLARSLNPGDVELTPVQAWFELAERYPVDRVLAGGALDALLREFKGVVRCVAYGSAIERLAFESVVTRVLGHAPAAPI
ncbi:hypothetical protein G6O67_007139 [Ophiocordyceps sinensis]|uniref:Uncharacterized protein n=1 Tax=Ophiocordyceps sinensis TaxID=72228 RepID=A0A8H4PKK0_9HYPO|nr:hypothetical protein G6O67_007139 [Ophiocordyceps sinensis]